MIADVEKAEKALRALVETVNATGGLAYFYGDSEQDDDELAPVADDEWTDLADAYLAACEALGVEPKIDNKKGET